MKIYSYQIMSEIGSAGARRFRQDCCHFTVKLIKMSRIHNKNGYIGNTNCKLQISRIKCQSLYQGKMLQLQQSKGKVYRAAAALSLLGHPFVHKSHVM